ncbi:MAG: glycosyltransferase [Acidimicrobiia bacterium]|nr:glycosyltransferase [Acidimicrobiia bacterium]
MPSSDPTDRDPVVSLFATMRDEPRGRVDALLDSLAAQDFAGELELVIAVPPADVASVTASTARWARGRVCVIENPSGLRSQGLNRALDHSRGTYAVRVDARSRPTPDHVRRCVARLQTEPAVGVVGGVQGVAPIEGAAPMADGIGRALNNRWLLGNAAYRDPAASGAVDTVYLGAFRTAEATRLRYDEDLTANEDYDLCQRYRALGSTVWLERGLTVAYEPRTRLDDLFGQYHAFGRSKVAYWQRSGRGPAGRQQLAIGVGVLAVAAAAAAARKPRRLTLGATAVVAIYATTDLLSDRRTGRRSVPMRTRAASICAHCAIQTGWLSGIVVEAAAARRRRRVR